MADVQGKLDEIVAIIEHAKSRAMSTNQAVVPRIELLGALEQLRELLPTEMSEARQVLRERDLILDGAKAEGRRLLSAAHEECQRLVGEHEVVERAEQEAQDMLDYARDQSARMRRETDIYVDSALARVQALLGTTLDTVETGRERIRAEQSHESARLADDNERVVDLAQAEADAAADGPAPGTPHADEHDQSHPVPGMGSSRHGALVG